METRLPDGHTPESPLFKRVILAMVAAGLASFNALYCTQALLPILSDDLGVSPSTASLTVSATTGMLALSIIPASILSEQFGRKRIIMASAILATFMGLALPFAPTIGWLILLRGLQGLAVAGVPATAMTYLSEEIHPKHVSRIMGLYVAGTSIGGLSGRIVPSLILEIANWRWALAGTVIFAITFALITCWALPDQQRFQPKKITLATETAAIKQHCTNPRLVAMFLLAFLFMGSFVSLYDYLGYRLTHHFHLSEGLAGAVFLLYLSGTWSASRAGNFVERFGRPLTLSGSVAGMLVGLAITFSPELISSLFGVLIFTASFFAAHSVASGWVGLTATKNRAEASSMYLFAYYMGSSILGWLSGVFFHLWGWNALVTWLLCAVGVSAVIVGLIVRATPKRQRLVGSL